MSSPLWEVMQVAYFQGRDPGCSEPHGYAAEIRALADWIEKRQIDTYAVVIPDVAEVISWLRAEAERAEGRE